MAVGVVAGNSLSQPENVRHAEIIAQVLFDLPLGQVRIAIGVQQTRLGREQRPVAVHVNRAAFQNDPRREEGELPQIRDVLGDGIVEVERRVFAAPRVVAPVNDRPLVDAVVVAHQKNGAVIAAPRLVSGEMMEQHLIERNVVLLQ